ncbi:hypothetical protein FQN50_010035 [Emmonsiellopsis sp. PD_5]|nr:hypothetical protein FQN50_010035 [Emmonsiellopsis sp. PD_5]
MLLHQWAVSFKIQEKSKKQKHSASNDDINNVKTLRHDTVTNLPSEVKIDGIILKDDLIPKDDLLVNPSPNAPAATADPAGQSEDGLMAIDSLTPSLSVNPSSDASAATANPASQSEDGPIPKTSTQEVIDISDSNEQPEANEDDYKDNIVNLDDITLMN